MERWVCLGLVKGGSYSWFRVGSGLVFGWIRAGFGGFRVRLELVYSWFRVGV